MTTTWRARAKVTKRLSPDSTPNEIVHADGNLLVYGGASAIWECLLGRGGAIGGYFDKTAQLGVGDGTANINDPTQTGLSNAVYASLDPGFPQHVEFDDNPPIISDAYDYLTTYLFYSATFPDSSANFAWNECGVFNKSGRMLNRFCYGDSANLGTKNGGWWTLEIQLVLQG